MTTPAHEFDGDLEARDRRVAEAAVEGCSNDEIAQRAGSKATTKNGLYKFARRLLKTKRVQALILELGTADDAGLGSLEDVALSTLRTTLEDNTQGGSNARIRAVDLVLRRVEKHAERMAKARGVVAPSEFAQEERRTIILEAARGILLASTPAVRAEFFRGLDLEGFGEVPPPADDAEPTDPEPKS